MVLTNTLSVQKTALHRQLTSLHVYKTPRINWRINNQPESAKTCKYWSLYKKNLSYDKCSHFIPPGNTTWPLVFPSSQGLSLWKGILKIFCKFTEHPCQSAISIKLICKFIEITLRHGWSVNLLHIFTTPFRKNTFGGPADLCIKQCHFSGGSDQNTSHLFYFVLNPL